MICIVRKIQKKLCRSRQRINESKRRCKRTVGRTAASLSSSRFVARLLHALVRCSVLVLWNDCENAVYATNNTTTTRCSTGSRRSHNDFGFGPSCTMPGGTPVPGCSPFPCAPRSMANGFSPGAIPAPPPNGPPASSCASCGGSCISAGRPENGLSMSLARKCSAMRIVSGVIEPPREATPPPPGESASGAGDTELVRGRGGVLGTESSPRNDPNVGASGRPANVSRSIQRNATRRTRPTRIHALSRKYDASSPRADVASLFKRSPPRLSNAARRAAARSAAEDICCVGFRK